MGRQCTRVTLADGTVALVTTNSNGNERALCDFCTTIHETLCDFPLRGKRKGRTCSKRMCAKCATRLGENRDLCPSHMKLVRDAGVEIQLAGLLVESNPNGHEVALDLLEQLAVPAKVAFKPKVHRVDKRVVTTAGQDWDEFWRERAAIFEYLGNYPRDVAEKMAHAEAGPRPR